MSLGSPLVSRLTAATAVVGLVASVAAAEDIYHLGTLGGTSSDGSGVNDAGQVAGTSYITDDVTFRAFRYDGTPGSGGVMRNLGTLGGTQSSGSDINNAGQVMGVSLLTGDVANHAFRYDGTPGSGGVMHNLGTLGGTNSYGGAINDAGQVAGGSDITGDAAFHAFRYDGTPGSGGVMHDLGTLGGTWSAGSAINDSQQVAGSSLQTGNAAARAYRYDGTPGSGGVMHNLGTLPGGLESYGLAINDAGQVVGYSAVTLEAEGPSHAFLYIGTPGSGGVMHDLGTLGGTSSYGSGINDAGQVVGGSTTLGETNDRAFLYIGTPGVDGQMINLDAWLDANNPVEGAKWLLTSAHDLSNTGWITGVGRYDPDGPGGVEPESHAFLLDASSLVPEPGALGLLALGAGIMLLRRRPLRT